jgi:hypothetical protein
VVNELALGVNQSGNAAVSRFNKAATLKHRHLDEVEGFRQERSDR